MTQSFSDGAPGSASPGFSLVEMLVAVAIGGLVTVSLIELLADSKATYLRETEYARLQEDARLTALLASEKLRTNRSLGCRGIALVEQEGQFTVEACKLLDTPSGADCDHDGWKADPTFLSMDRALGYDNSADLSNASNLTDLPGDGAINIAARWLRGDVFVTWGVDGAGAGVTSTLTSVTAQDGGYEGAGMLEIAAIPDGVEQGSLALVTDCVAADLFEVTGPDGLESNGDVALAHEVSIGGNDRSSNASDTVSRAYNWALESAPAAQERMTSHPLYRATVYPFSYDAYYVCCLHTNDRSIQSGSDVDRCTEEGSDFDRYRPSLCVWSAEDGQSRAVVTNVADLRVTYTGDEDGDGELDFHADDTAPTPTAAWVSSANGGRGAWAGVRAAALEVLVATGRDNVGTASKLPASDAWPPGTGEGVMAGDTLGADLPADKRLYRRLVVNVAMRARTPWYIAP